MLLGFSFLLYTKQQLSVLYTFLFYLSPLDILTEVIKYKAKFVSDNPYNHRRVHRSITSYITHGWKESMLCYLGSRDHVSSQQWMMSSFKSRQHRNFQLKMHALLNKLSVKCRNSAHSCFDSCSWIEGLPLVLISQVCFLRISTSGENSSTHIYLEKEPRKQWESSEEVRQAKKDSL